MTSGRDHLEECTVDGCEECEHLMEFYTACDGCGYWMHKDTEYHVLEDGRTLCNDCFRGEEQ